MSFHKGYGVNFFAKIHLNNYIAKRDRNVIGILINKENDNYLCAMIRVKRYISILLLACLLPVVTPVEFVHDLFGHEDTHDGFQPSVSIDKAHRHCLILQITFSTFISNLNTFLIGTEFNQFAHSCFDPCFIPGISVNLSCLRAPPSYHS